MSTRHAAFILALLSVAAVAPISGADQGTEPRERAFSGTYTLALGWSNDLPAQTAATSQGSVGLMAAVVTCGDSREQTNGLGGSCAPTFVDVGEVIDITVADVQAPEVRFMACVDGDNDGVCRPEFPNDSIYIEPCDDGDNTLTVQHTGKMGTLDVYILNGLASPCVPRQGSITGHVRRLPECSDLKDNDGDGATDYPFDPNCDSPFDDMERPPQCSDGIDNDHSGRVDWPSDPGCDSPNDDFEWSPECSNLKDDDGDGRTDWPNDPDCSSPDDNSERFVRVN